MRKNGILLHITSLPSKYGIGTLGEAAYDFVDFLKKTDQSIWQVLPLNPTGYGDSPYASYSSFAGNPYLIDLDYLVKDGLLKPSDLEEVVWFEKPDQVDFGIQYNKRYPLLEKAVKKFQEKPEEDYAAFCEEQKEWLDDYALFMALKDANEGKAWLDWDEKYRKYDAAKAEEWKKENKERMEYYKVLQYLFFKQWNALRKYANENGIEILGDLPIYVALDSVDAWSNPDLFLLDEKGKPAVVAGCPPDGFSADGQLWGNPIYNWSKQKENDYAWWMRRIAHATNMLDILRIDHFRGFDSFYTIPYGAENARVGEWKQGPGIDFFNVLKEKLGDRKIVAEDLGYLTDSVKELLAATGYPGMKILEFAFDSRDDSGSEYLPYNYQKNSIAYPGTHDNDTIQGWFQSISGDDKKYAQDFMDAYNPDEYNWEMIRTVMASPSDTSIIQAQDLLNLDSSARMNTPGKSQGNWTWRLKPDWVTPEIEGALKWLTKLYGRAPKPVQKVEAPEIKTETTPDQIEK